MGNPWREVSRILSTDKTNATPATTAKSSWRWRTGWCVRSATARGVRRASREPLHDAPLGPFELLDLEPLRPRTASRDLERVPPGSGAHPLSSVSEQYPFEKPDLPVVLRSRL